MINFFFKQKIESHKSKSRELISILIPARNEEKNIPSLIESLQKIKTNNIEIIIYNDQSTDQTAQIIRKYSVSDPQIKLIEAKGLPYGWLGKNHACYQLAQHAKGDYFLFMDADVRLYDSIIEDAVAYVKKYNLGLLSVFPFQIQKTWGEKATVPIMNYILLTLLPLILVRTSPYVSLSAANGQFMLFNANLYIEHQPHKVFKKSAVEDINIARFYKKQKIKMTCLTGESRIKCRMYSGYKESLNGFSKNVFMFFGNHVSLAFLFWFFVALGFIPFLFLAKIHLVIYLGMVVFTQFSTSIISNQNPIYNIILLPIHFMFLLQVMVKSIIEKKKKRHTWKGRYIYS